MADKYGGTEFPVPIPLWTGFPEDYAPGDVLLGYLGSFLRTIITVECRNIWESISPGVPIVRKVFCDGPENILNENDLPALYIYRPGRETREVIETFEQIADDYRMQKGRVVVQWIMHTDPAEQRKRRDQMIDPIRKAIDLRTVNGRFKPWIVPGDDDPDSEHYDKDAAVWGSSILTWTGANVIELDHASPGQYQHKMSPPARSRMYEELKMSFLIWERAELDINEAGDAPNDELEAHYESPDQGTGLGPFDLGDAIYK